MANSVKYGVRKLHYAILTETVVGGIPSYAYANPVAIPGSVSISFDADGSSDPFYADDTVYFRASANNGYTGSIEVADLPDSFRTDVLGEVLDSTDKVILESKGADVKHVAIMFEEEGNVSDRKFLFYEVIFSRPNGAKNTTTESITPQTQTLNFSAIPRSDGAIKAITTDETTEAVKNAWYTSVWEA